MGGVGIVRVSGSQLTALIKDVAVADLKPRIATVCLFRDFDGSAIDQGLAIYFPGPHSFTGEDVLELHGHGGPVVLDRLLNRIIQSGARLAEPGEFTERAFLNGKIDLTQAEAIADLIAARSEQATRGAMRVLNGELSGRIEPISSGLVHMRVQIEASIDFPDEEIEVHTIDALDRDLRQLSAQLESLIDLTQEGLTLAEGLRVAIVGRPNAGKSSLLNALTGEDRAIVTATPGTTRDVVKEYINIEGLPVQLFDTAGLRDTRDPVEREGVKRARLQIAEADSVFWIVDSTAQNPDEALKDARRYLPDLERVTLVFNKVDLLATSLEIQQSRVETHSVIYISAKTGAGLSTLKAHLLKMAGINGGFEGRIVARRRHVVALQQTLDYLVLAKARLPNSEEWELVAEDLRQAQGVLGTITGVVTTDDLLGEIFSSFCIGK